MPDRSFKPTPLRSADQLRRWKDMRTSVVLMVLLVAGCTRFAPPIHGANENLPATAFPDLPSDVRQVAERLSSCAHFAGEMGGDGSDRDEEVASTMVELRCETIDRDVSMIQHKYAGNRAVQDALAAASQR